MYILTEVKVGIGLLRVAFRSQVNMYFKAAGIWAGKLNGGAN